MSKAPGPSQITHWRTIEWFHRGLDQTYQQLLQLAKADWEQLFTPNKPSDGCVSVRISGEETTNELAGVPRAGFIPVRRQPTNGKMKRWSA
jgi:hypothetical protein